MKITIKELKTLIKETIKKKQQRLLEQKQLKEELFEEVVNVNIDNEEQST